jgi:hypothetical protein
MRIKNFNNGAYAIFEKMGAWFHVIARGADGNVIDRIRCDNYREALQYWRAFKLLAKNS